MRKTDILNVYCSNEEFCATAPNDTQDVTLEEAERSCYFGYRRQFCFKDLKAAIEPSKNSIHETESVQHLEHSNEAETF